MTLSLKNFATTWDMFPGPCYDPQVEYDDCPATMLDILNDERIPAKDRIWAFANCVEIPTNIKRMAAVRVVRETPIANGRFVFDLLTDQRSINALVVAERHANGEATDKELRDAASAAAYAAYAAASADADAAASADASAAAAYAAADAAAADADAYAAAHKRVRAEIVAMAVEALTGGAL